MLSMELLRSSRATQPHASPSHPLETHARASGVFPRSSGSPPVASFYASDESEDGDVSLEEPTEDPLELDPTFLPGAPMPGTVRIKVESTTFWAHREILYFASPFFEAALSGDWLETGRPLSIASSVITISQPPSIPPGFGTESTSGDAAPPVEQTQVNEDELSDTLGVFTINESEDESGEPSPSEDVAQAREDAFRKLQRPANTLEKRSTRRPDAYIELKEEKATTFHDFLKFIYPNLVCVITWNNVEGLMNMSHKLVVPTLSDLCLRFLLHHAGARPIKAMRIAELFNEEELYREASRFVLDNPGGWAESELKTLSHESLLKLEKRRNWFLERMLKLGSVSIAKEYLCCSTCPDTANCARLVEEKWRQGYHALLRFGPPQPSMVFRYLRSLEGISPPLALTHYSCQLCAKAWVATLFDRMFELGVRGSGGTDLPLDPRLPNPSTGPRRHFLFCLLRNPNQKPPRKSRSHA